MTQSSPSKKYRSTIASLKEKTKIRDKMSRLQKRYHEKITPPSNIYHSCDVSGRNFVQASLVYNYLFRWAKSVYKLIWLDFTIWVVLYTSISLSYRLLMNSDQKGHFEDLVKSFKDWSGGIPATFLLGFFVSNVISRWWKIYDLIPRMQFLAISMRRSINIADNETEAARLRKELSRYLNLSWFVCCRAFCGTLKSRFRTLRAISKCQKKLEKFETAATGDELLLSVSVEQEECHASSSVQHKHNKGDVCTLVEDLELMNEDLVAKKVYCDENQPNIKVIYPHEVSAFDVQHHCEDFNALTFKDDFPTDWRLPLYWAIKMAEDKEREGVFSSDSTKAIVDIVKDWESRLVKLEICAIRNIPLVYTQVVMIAVYSIYFINVISTQYIDPNRAKDRKISGHFSDHYIPVIGLLQVVFMIGWFKVALVLMDPFGDDEEDFPFSHIFNDNLRVGYIMDPDKECPLYTHESVQGVNKTQPSDLENSGHSHA